MTSKNNWVLKSVAGILQGVGKRTSAETACDCEGEVLQ